MERNKVSYILHAASASGGKPDERSKQSKKIRQLHSCRSEPPAWRCPVSFELLVQMRGHCTSSGWVAVVLLNRTGADNSRISVCMAGLLAPVCSLETAGILPSATIPVATCAHLQLCGGRILVPVGAPAQHSQLVGLLDQLGKGAGGQGRCFIRPPETLRGGMCGRSRAGTAHSAPPQYLTS